MYDLMEQILRLQTPFNMIVLVVLITTVAGVITSIAKQFRKFASQRLELDLKREMLDRGMTAEEIAQVIEATPLPKDGVGRWVASWGKCGKTRKQNL